MAFDKIDNIPSNVTFLADQDPMSMRVSIPHNGFNVLCLNIRSVFKNFDTLYSTLGTYRLENYFTVIVLTECWLQKNSIVPSLPGYCFASASSYLNKSSGIVIFTHSSLKVVSIEDQCDKVDMLNVILRHELGLLRLSGIYKSPQLKNCELLKHIIRRMK